MSFEVKVIFFENFDKIIFDIHPYIYLFSSARFPCHYKLRCRLRSHV